MSYPLRDQVALVGLGATPFSRDARRSPTALAVDACLAAVEDAGIGLAEVDGLAGSNAVSATVLQAALGIPETTWWNNSAIPFAFQIMVGAQAVYAGACEVALAYHVAFRSPSKSRAAGSDPLRARIARTVETKRPAANLIAGPPAYAAWASRYLHEYGVDRQVFGRIAINARSNARRNDQAVLRERLELADYLAAPIIREPFSMFDMDYPIDGAVAVVLTRAERAGDLRHRPVLLHAAAAGRTDRPEEDQTLDLRHTGQNVALRALWRRSTAVLADVDVFLPYDGFTFLALRWLENVGYCGDGEGSDFVAAHWDMPGEAIRINARVPLNPHGGSLAEGATQAAGHVREAVLQLRGDSGARQVPDATCALVTAGGFFHNASALLLRAG